MDVRRFFDYRVVYFATPGLVAGEVKGFAEPLLALTSPKEPTDADDGLLTASEVAQLKLNADWVVLSACNTIAGDKPGAEALSGLARAFFSVHCELDTNRYPKAIVVTDEEMDAINIKRAKFHGEWNYTIRPNNRLDRAADS